MVQSERCPDFKGIETGLDPISIKAIDCPKDALISKGLRLIKHLLNKEILQSERCPDFKGIETKSASPSNMPRSKCPKDALISKGLRQQTTCGNSHG